MISKFDYSIAIIFVQQIVVESSLVGETPGGDCVTVLEVSISTAGSTDGDLLLIAPPDDDDVMLLAPPLPLDRSLRLNFALRFWNHTYFIIITQE